MALNPIASLARLKELGLDRSQYGSCSEPEQKSIKNKGRVWINRGCTHWHDCPMRLGTDYQKPQTAEERAKTGISEAVDAEPRPRMCRTQFIKPNSMGQGDRVTNSYRPCYSFIGGIGRRDGKNNEIAEVTGGEGDLVTIKGTVRVTSPEGAISFKPTSRTVPVPRFPDPTEVDELFEDIYAAKSRAENKSRTVDANRKRRLEGAAEREEMEAGMTFTDVDPKTL